MSRVFRCKNDLELWACDGRQAGNEVIELHCRLRHEENDTCLGHSVRWEASGVQPYVAEAGDWCNCDARCGVGNDAVQVGAQGRRTYRASVRVYTDAVRALFEAAFTDAGGQR